MNSPNTENHSSPDNDDRLVAHRGIRTLLFTIGGISLSLGVIGIFLPLLPTTPFLLLAAACYLRSSPRFYHWLLSHPVLSKYLLAYLDGKGIPRRAKLYTTLPLWISLLFSCYLVPLTWVRVGLITVGVGVTVYIWRLPELQPVSDQDAQP